MRALIQRSVAAAVLVVGVGSAAQADYSNTFDTGIAPLRYDFGGTNATATFDSTHNTGGPAGSGSAKLSFGFANNTGLAYTADVFATPTTIYNVSFDVFVDPASPFGAANHGAGYFQVAARQTDGYTFVDSGYNENLGNPGYDSVTHYGVWEHISINFTATTGANVRAITFQDYNNDNINTTSTPVTYYLDNLVISTTPPGTPEPASLGLIAVAGSMLLRRRRD